MYEVWECDDEFEDAAAGLADAYTEVVYLWESVDGVGAGMRGGWKG